MRRLVGLLGILAVLTANSAAIASAHFDPNHARGASAPGSITLSSTGDGQGTIGFIAPAGFDPLGGYPAAPPAGSTPSNEGFAGTINATSNSSPPVTIQAYCIDLRTSTWVGISYELGTWSASAVPNVDRVARLLNDYFPNTGQPAAAPNDAARAASVQAAIWFFTDRYILDASDPVHDLTAAIVTDVLSKPPLPEPSLPLSVNGPATGVTGQTVGPFTITTTAANVVVHVTGGQLFSNAGATIPIADGATVPASTQLFLVPNAAGTATITVDAAITAPSGRVLLYLPANPASPDPVTAQKLILAGDALVTASADATVRVTDPTPPPSVPASASPSEPPSAPPSEPPSAEPSALPSEPVSQPPSEPPSAGPSEPASEEPSFTGGVLPATGTPGSTLPPTSTDSVVTGDGSAGPPLLIIAIVALGASLLIDGRRRRSRRR